MNKDIVKYETMLVFSITGDGDEYRGIYRYSSNASIRITSVPKRDFVTTWGGRKVHIFPSTGNFLKRNRAS